MSLSERFQEMDLEFGVIHAGAKVTQFGAVGVGAKPSCHLADDTELTLTWQHLGAKPSAIDLGAELLPYTSWRLK
jgi:hypothetical protein